MVFESETSKHQRTQNINLQKYDRINEWYKREVNIKCTFIYITIIVNIASYNSKRDLHPLDTERVERLNTNERGVGMRKEKF